MQLSITMALYTYDIFDDEQEIAELANKARRGGMSIDDYNRCIDIFQALGNTAKAIRDSITGQQHVHDTPPFFFEKFRLSTNLHQLQTSTIEVIKACAKLSHSTNNSESRDILSGHIENTAQQLVNIRHTLPPSTKKITRKKGGKAKRLKSEKVLNDAILNDTEQERYPRFSTTTLDYSLNNGQS